jgi:HEAT repeat protein
VLTAAVQHGLALPGGLPDRAISLGVAPDAPALVAATIDAFAKTSAKKDRGGLSAERAADNWESLLKMAADGEVAIDTDTHDLAWRAIRSVRGGGDKAIDEAKLPDMGAPELVLLLEHPRHRRAAALELCRRKDATFADTLSKSVRKMPRAEVVRIVPRMAELGDEAGDAIIDGLSARKTFVRQAFALALGHLKLRRAVVPLVHLLSSEQSEVWREVARVVGTFGNASLRNVTRLLKDPKGNEERYAWTLAHLSNNGCAKQVERLTSEDDAGVVEIARQALTLRQRARALDEQVRGGASLPGGDAILTFSRRFYQELEGKAPADDLEEGPGADT